MKTRKNQGQRGVLLTLGITFVCLVVLSFAGLILRNAENSDVRLTELSAIDRLYTLGSSLERGVAKSYYPTTGINLTVNNDTITLAKSTKRSGSPNYYQQPDYPDPGILNMKVSDAYIQLLAESLSYKTATVDTSLSFSTLLYLMLFFYYPLYDSDFAKTFMIYTYTGETWNFTKESPGGYHFRHTLAGASYCCLEIGNATEIYPINSTTQTFLLGNALNNLTEVIIKARHPSRCPYINWSDTGTRRKTNSGNPPPGEIKTKITFQAENEKDPCPTSYSYYKDTEANAILNKTDAFFSHIIFLDNLTGDPDFSTYNFIYDCAPPTACAIPPGASKERPVIFFFDSNVTGAPLVSSATNLLVLAQYDNPIDWEVTLKFKVGPVEVYSTEYITTNLSLLNMTRENRPARFR